uniref:Tctex1 domain containing 1 n=2 Tax=Salarias fasciatus TaxID=181472 RepID=A0A672HIT8_SALFA
SISTVSGMDELGHHDDMMTAKTMPNTYQLGPSKRFPISTVTDILKDVLATNLQLEKYEVEWARKMTKTLSEVIKAGVKDLMIPRYKLVVLVTIGELAAQGMQMNSRCLWDANNDNFASYSFKNNSLFGVAIVYGIYME